MSSRVTLDSTSASILHSTPNSTVHSAALDTLTFTNYSPRRIQACLDSTIMTYLQQQQPPPHPPHAPATQHRKHLYQNKYQQQSHHGKAPALQHHQQQGHSKGAETTYPHALQKRVIIDTPAKTGNHPSGHHLVHPGTGSRISFPHSPGDQAIDEGLTTTLHSQAKGVAPTRDQLCLLEIKVLAPVGAHHTDEEDHSNYDDSDYDDKDDGEDSEEAVDKNGGEGEISEMDDSESDYVSHDSHVETEQPMLAPSGSGTVYPDQHINSDSARRDQQELLRQLTIAASALSSGDIHGAAHSSSADPEAGVSDYRRRAPSNVSGHEHRVVVQEAPLDETSRIYSQHTTPILADSIPRGTTLLVASPDTGVSDQSHGLQPSAALHNLPYVDEEEDEEEEGDDYEEEFDDEGSEFDEDDYSYSEDDGEDEDEGESLAEYHHGTREDPQARVAAKGRSSQSGHYPRSGYPHYRPPRLDENFLRKRAITKQVVRRSSLTVLLGEVLQTETEQRGPAVRQSAGTAFGQYQRHSGATTRRPALSSVWTEATPTNAMLPPSDVSKGKSNFSSDTQAQTAITPRVSMISDQHHPAIIRPASAISDAQGSQRPRRTDSGVEVKLFPNQCSGSATSDGSSQLQPSRFVVTKLFNESTSQLPSAAKTTTTTSVAIESARRPRIKSEGDSPEQGSLYSSTSVGNNLQAGGSSGSASGSKSLQFRKPIKSSISCHTFPRAAGKRVGQKHVSWHHSLFPTEHILRVKPSLPSLSSVAVESAEAKLSQLPSIPVMARDNVMAFHQSIRSLRTLSRIEIARMSYKQQGRQELTSPTPISKSVNDSIPWWNPTRWLKGSVEIDKRHWKPDDSRESCAYCFAPFHRLTNPRHHCRKCGDIFCGKCASAEILMDAKNCVYVQQSQLARWSRRVDLQRHSLWIDTLPQLHPVRTAAESGLVASSDGHGSVGHAGGIGNGASTLGGVSMGHRGLSGNGSGSGRGGSWQMAPGASKKSRLSIFGLFGNGAPVSSTGNAPSDSRRGSVDVASTESMYTSHYLQPHSQNTMAVTFAPDRRPSSSSIMRGSSVGSSAHLMMTNAPPTSAEGGMPSIAMSRRMSSGGVGEVCLARICVGCERELLRPVPRCNSIAKYYGSVNSRNGYRPPGYGYSSLGPHAGRQHPGPQTGPLHPLDDNQTITGNHDYLANGVRRHSPLRQASHIENMTTHAAEDHPTSHDVPSYDVGSQGRWNSREDTVGPHGEARYHPSVLTFQEQPLHYTQQTPGRELC